MLMIQMTFEEEGKKGMKIAIEFCVQSEHLPPDKKTHVVIQPWNTSIYYTFVSWVLHPWNTLMHYSVEGLWIGFTKQVMVFESLVT